MCLKLFCHTIFVLADTELIRKLNGKLHTHFRNVFTNHRTVTLIGCGQIDGETNRLLEQLILTGYTSSSFNTDDDITKVSEKSLILSKSKHQVKYYYFCVWK